MLDGRKWSAVPIVMVLGGITLPYFREEFRLLATQDDAVLVEAATEFQPTVKAIQRAVRKRTFLSGPVAPLRHE